MDDKYDLKKHVNFRYTEDGGASPYDYAKTPLAHDDLKIDINRLDDYELLSTEDILGEQQFFLWIGVMCIEETSRRRKKQNEKECNGKNDTPDADGEKAEEMDGVLYDTGSYCNRRDNHGVCSRRSAVGDQ